jgi:hypothetical protein
LKGQRQEIIENTVTNLVQGHVEVSSTHFERQPSQIAVAQMIALGAGFAALAFFRTSQLFELAVKLAQSAYGGHSHLEHHARRLVLDGW